MLKTLISLTLLAASLSVGVQAATAAQGGSQPTAYSAAPCALAPRADDKSGPKRYLHAPVWLYGDSITAQSWRGLGVKRMAVDAVWGRLTADAAKHFRADINASGRRPKVVVFATGTNDRWRPQVMRKQIDRVKRIAGKKTRVIWVDVYTKQGSWLKVSRAIRKTKGIKVVRWARANVASSRTLLNPDGVHLSEDGCGVRNALINQALSSVI